MFSVPEYFILKYIYFLPCQVNAAPKGGDDDQEIPRKLRLIQKSKVEASQCALAAKIKKVRPADHDPDLLDSTKHMGSEMRLKGMKRPLKPIPVFRQNPGESQRRFFNRMERQVQVR